MLLLLYFCYHCLIYTFHDLTRIDLTMMVTFVYGLAWYLEIIRRLLSDMQVWVMSQG